MLRASAIRPEFDFIDEPMSTPPIEPTEEELRAYEEQIRRVRVEHVLLQGVADLVNFGMRRTGRAEGTESERDLEQVRVAIESVRALLPILDQSVPEQAPAIRDALSQLQREYVRLVGAGSAGGAGGGAGGDAGGGAGGDAGGGGGGDAGGGAPGGGPAPEPAKPDPATPGPAAPEPAPGAPGEPGPAQRSGRLWVPGQ
jgi:hypothetical protein